MNQPAGICHEIIHPSTRHDKVHLSGVSTPPGTPFTPERGGHKLAGNDEAFQKQGNAQMWATLGGGGSVPGESLLARRTTGLIHPNIFRSLTVTFRTDCPVSPRYGTKYSPFPAQKYRQQPGGGTPINTRSGSYRLRGRE